MIDLENIQRLLKDKKLTEVSKKSGVNYQTVWEVVTGKSKNTSYNTVKKLSDYLFKYGFYRDNGSFMWDEYISVAKYKDIYDNWIVSPVNMTYAPNMMSTDGKQIYLNIPDVSVFVDDIKSLLYYFNYIYDSIRHFHSGSYCGVFDSDKMSRLVMDYMTIYYLLKSSDKLPENYEFPEHHLAIAMGVNK